MDVNTPASDRARHTRGLTGQAPCSVSRLPQATGVATKDAVLLIRPTQQTPRVGAQHGRVACMHAVPTPLFARLS